MLAVALGVLVGTVLGLTGAGGSVLAVPLLMWALGWSLPQAAPVALLAVAIASGLGAWRAWQQRRVRYRAALLMGAAALLSAPLGSWAVTRLPLRPLELAFALILLLVSLRMIWQATHEEHSAEQALTEAPLCRLNPETGRLIWTPRSTLAVALLGAVTGLLSGLFGVGGGFAIVPGLRLISSLSMHSIVATSLLAVALVSLITLTAALIQGRPLPWLVALPFVAGTVAGMFAGRRLAPRVAGARLQQGFAGLLVAVALLMGQRALFA